MQFESFHWLSHHGLGTIGPCSTNMVSVCMIFWGIFIFILVPVLYFGGGFNKTIIPLTLVRYQMIIANSYPRCSHGIIVDETRP